MDYQPNPNHLVKELVDVSGYDYEIHGLFVNPVYIVKRPSITINEEEEEKEIEDIIAEGMQPNTANKFTKNTYIFDTKLNNLKAFCYRHIKKYVDDLIQPSNHYLEFYITQSWINVTKPGGHHPKHIHPNSIISGVYYYKMEESDGIAFYDPNWKIKQAIRIEPVKGSPLGGISMSIRADAHQLFLFPSWMEHGVHPNPQATTDRISISFNVFVKGDLVEDRASLGALLLQ